MFFGAVGVGDCLRRWWWVAGCPGTGGGFVCFLFGLLARGLFAGFLVVLAFPCFHVGLFALPFRLFACGVGLSLFWYWSICTAPVRGGTYFSLPPQRKVGKRKRAQTASP
jgi:hypothetical protein